MLFRSVEMDKRVGQIENNCRDEAKMKKTIAENNKEIERLREQLCLYKVDNKEKEVEILKDRVDQLTKNQTNINNKIIQKNNQIQKLEAELGPISKDTITELKQLKTKFESCIS